VLTVLPALAQKPATNEYGWPKELDTGGAHFVIYQPEVQSWQNDRLAARSVISVRPKEGANPLYGIASISARTKTNASSRTVTLEEVNVTSADFPTARADQPRFEKQIQESVSQWPHSMPLDKLRADLAVTQAQAEPSSTGLKNTPPNIIFSPRRAILVLVDGEPVYRPVQGARYTPVINTPALLLFDSSQNQFYLDTSSQWRTAPALSGPWTVVTDPPADLDQVKAQIKQAEENGEAPQPPQTAAAANGAGAAGRGGPANAAAPRVPPGAAVYVSTTPAELLQTRGQPQFSPLAETHLTYVTNSDNDLFMDLDTQAYYTLLSGRWFTAKALRGPWTFVAGDQLPHDFSAIPADSPKASVLASVSGTPQAREAVIANQAPQTATVDRRQAKLQVRYDGEPQFKPIEGTSLQYAVNTSTEVVQAGSRYYACHNAVWFVADSSAGPWVVADTIPAEIYSIPPSSPLYHVRYARIYYSTPDLVYVGYTPGYLGAYLWGGTVVFGTGWAYPPWYGSVWYGWPWTWGFGFHFGWGEADGGGIPGGLSGGTETPGTRSASGTAPP